MNERIKEQVLWPLIAKAKEFATTNGEHLHQFDLDMFHNKLAELIIKECATVYRDNVKSDRLLFPTEFSAELQKHFGVKE